MFVSITRLTIRHWRFLLPFAWRTLQSSRQLRRASGFLGGFTAAGKGLSFWTVTGWEDSAAMKAYRNSGAHVAAMPKLIRWCSEAAVASIEQDTLPDIKQAAAHLAANGRLSKVRHPSSGHRAGLTLPSSALPSSTQTLTPL